MLPVARQPEENIEHSVNISDGQKQELRRRSENLGAQAKAFMTASST